MYNEIIPNLFLGGQQDAIDFDQKFGESGTIICVLENRPQDEPFRSYHIPVRTSSGHVHMEQLNQISWFLDKLLDNNVPTLVHCAAGLERSPITVAYHLHLKNNISVNDAYKLIEQKREGIIEHMEWLVP